MAKFTLSNEPLYERTIDFKPPVNVSGLDTIPAYIKEIGRDSLKVNSDAFIDSLISSNPNKWQRGAFQNVDMTPSMIGGGFDLMSEVRDPASLQADFRAYTEKEKNKILFQSMGLEDVAEKEVKELQPYDGSRSYLDRGFSPLEVYHQTVMPFAEEIVNRNDHRFGDYIANKAEEGNFGNWGDVLKNAGANLADGMSLTATDTFINPYREEVNEHRRKVYWDQLLRGQGKHGDSNLSHFYYDYRLGVNKKTGELSTLDTDKVFQALRGAKFTKKDENGEGFFKWLREYPMDVIGGYGINVALAVNDINNAINGEDKPVKEIFTDYMKRHVSSSTMRDDTVTAIDGMMLDLMHDPAMWVPRLVSVPFVVAGKTVKAIDRASAIPNPDHKKMSDLLSDSALGKTFTKGFIYDGLIKRLSNSYDEARKTSDFINELNIDNPNHVEIQPEDVMEGTVDFLGNKVRNKADESVELMNLRDNVFLLQDLDEGQLRLLQRYMTNGVDDSSQLVKEIIPKLKDKNGKPISTENADRMVEAARHIRSVLDDIGKADVKEGLLDEAALVPNYIPQMFPQGSKSQKAWEYFFKLQYGEDALGRVGEKKVGDWIKTFGIKSKMAFFTQQKSFKDTNAGPLRTSSAIPTELNGAVAMAKRGLESIRKRSTKRLWESTISDSRISIPIDADIALDETHELHKRLTDAGMKVWKLPKVSNHSKHIDGLDAVDEDVYYALPAPLVDNLENANKFFKRPEEGEEWWGRRMLNVWHEMQSVWKSYALMSTGYHARNMFSNLFNNHLGGVSDPKPYYEAMLLQIGDTALFKNANVRAQVENALGGRKTVDDYMFNLPDGTKISGRQMLDEGQSFDIDQGGLMDVEADTNFINTLMKDFEFDGQPSKYHIEEGLLHWGDKQERITTQANKIYRVVQDAGANVTEEEARITAEIYDVVASTWAFKHGKTPNEWYATRINELKASTVDRLRDETRKLKEEGLLPLVFNQAIGGHSGPRRSPHSSEVLPSISDKDYGFEEGDDYWERIKEFYPDEEMNANFIRGFEGSTVIHPDTGAPVLVAHGGPNLGAIYLEGDHRGVVNIDSNENIFGPGLYLSEQQKMRRNASFLPKRESIAEYNKRNQPAETRFDPHTYIDPAHGGVNITTDANQIGWRYGQVGNRLNELTAEEVSKASLAVQESIIKEFKLGKLGSSDPSYPRITNYNILSSIKDRQVKVVRDDLLDVFKRTKIDVKDFVSIQTQLQRAQSNILRDSRVSQELKDLILESVEGTVELTGLKGSKGLATEVSEKINDYMIKRYNEYTGKNLQRSPTYVEYDEIEKAFIEKNSKNVELKENVRDEYGWVNDKKSLYPTWGKKQRQKIVDKERRNFIADKNKLEGEKRISRGEGIRDHIDTFDLYDPEAYALINLLSISRASDALSDWDNYYRRLNEANQKMVLQGFQPTHAVPAVMQGYLDSKNPFVLSVLDDAYRQDPRGKSLAELEEFPEIMEDDIRKYQSSAAKNKSLAQEKDYTKIVWGYDEVVQFENKMLATLTASTVDDVTSTLRRISKNETEDLNLNEVYHTLQLLAKGTNKELYNQKLKFKYAWKEEESLDDALEEFDSIDVDDMFATEDEYFEFSHPDSPIEVSLYSQDKVLHRVVYDKLIREARQSNPNNKAVVLKNNTDKFGNVHQINHDFNLDAFFDEIRPDQYDVSPTKLFNKEELARYNKAMNEDVITTLHAMAYNDAMTIKRSIQYDAFTKNLGIQGNAGKNPIHRHSDYNQDAEGREKFAKLIREDPTSWNTYHYEAWHHFFNANKDLKLQRHHFEEIPILMRPDGKYNDYGLDGFDVSASKKLAEDNRYQLSNNRGLDMSELESVAKKQKWAKLNDKYVDPEAPELGEFEWLSNVQHGRMFQPENRGVVSKTNFRARTISANPPHFYLWGDVAKELEMDAYELYRRGLVDLDSYFWGEVGHSRFSNMVLESGGFGGQPIDQNFLADTYGTVHSEDVARGVNRFLDMFNNAKGLRANSHGAMVFRNHLAEELGRNTSSITPTVSHDRHGGMAFANNLLQKMGYDSITHADNFIPNASVNDGYRRGQSPATVPNIGLTHQTWIALSPSSFKEKANSGNFGFKTVENIFNQMAEEYGSGVVAGQVRFIEEGKADIFLTQAADPSTLLHELGHIVRQNMIAQHDKRMLHRWILGKEEEKKLYGEMLEEARLINGETYNTTTVHETAVELMDRHVWTKGEGGTEELFADTLIRFLTQGGTKNVTGPVVGTFKDIEQTLKVMYDVSGQGAIGLRMNDDAKHFFQRLFGRGVDEDPAQLQEAKNLLETEPKVAKLRDPLKIVANFTQKNFLTTANRGMGKALENNARWAHYIHKRTSDVGLSPDNGWTKKKKTGRGMTPEQAQASVKRYLFDYNELTPFERDIMKAFIPFYTWMRKNIPLQVHQLTQNPQKFYPIPKIQNTINAMSPEFENIPEQDYFAYSTMVRLPIKSEDLPYQRGGGLVYASLDLPFEDLNRINVHDSIASMSPFIKTWIEIYQSEGYDYFLDSKIEQYQDEPMYSGFMGEDETIPWTIDKKTEHALRSFFPLYGKASRMYQSAQQGKLGERLYREFAGIGLVTVDTDQVWRGNTHKEKQAYRAILARIKKNEKLLGGLDKAIKLERGGDRKVPVYDIDREN